MVSDDHQGSTTQEKSSGLKKLTCSMLVFLIDSWFTAARLWQKSYDRGDDSYLI